MVDEVVILVSDGSELGELGSRIKLEIRVLDNIIELAEVGIPSVIPGHHF